MGERHTLLDGRIAVTVAVTYAASVFGSVIWRRLPEPLSFLVSAAGCFLAGVCLHAKMPSGVIGALVVSILANVALQWIGADTETVVRSTCITYVALGRLAAAWYMNGEEKAE